MLKTIIALTTLFLSANLLADFNSISHKKLRMGEERVEKIIVGGFDQHYFDGCEEQGFHMAAEEISSGVYTFSMYCGPIPKGTKKYIVIRETGI